MKKIVSIIFIISLFSSCGYRPSSHYSKKIVTQKVYTEVDISLSDPENAVLVKDALNRALYTRIKSRASKREDTNSSIKVSYNSIHFIPLQYNKRGYVVYYQANISLKFLFEKGKEREERSLVGRYEFPIRPSAIISNDLRFRAIQKGSEKALDEFISYLSAKGLLDDTK